MAFERILCAIDFSDGSLAAFNKAVEIALQGSARLFVLHALEAQPVTSDWLGPDNLGEETVKLEQEALDALNSVLSSVASRLEGCWVHSEVTNGTAFMEILENARVWEADLIVLGAKGATSLEQVMYGSTAERVVREAECSVLVVRPT